MGANKLFLISIWRQKRKGTIIARIYRDKKKGKTASNFYALYSEYNNNNNNKIIIKIIHLL